MVGSTGLSWVVRIKRVYHQGSTPWRSPSAHSSFEPEILVLVLLLPIKKQHFCCSFKMVGSTGLEPATPTMSMWCATTCANRPFMSKSENLHFPRMRYPSRKNDTQSFFLGRVLTAHLCWNRKIYIFLGYATPLKKTILNRFFSVEC